MEDPWTRVALRNAHPEALFVSVHSGEGLDKLVEHLGNLVGEGNREIVIELPHARTELLARIHRDGVVHETAYEEECSRIRATVPERLRHALSEFIVS